MSFQLIGQTDFYRGKVRDVYFIGNEWLVMAASERISAFDVILPKLIPFKGQVLNEIAAYMLQQTADICPNWLISVPAPHVSIGRRCVPFRVEMVVRGNLTGHAWRTYQSGKMSLCGIPLPQGMRENDFFKTPIITPSTKAVEGHDEDISKEEIIAQGIVPTNYYDQMEAYSLALFERGRMLSKDKGLILVDTKYEFGLLNGEVVLMDEIHTPDSSRYFYADDFDKKQAMGEKQQQLSKEFVREWLISHDFMGKEGQVIPEMTEDWVEVISKRYIALYEKLTGLTFFPLQQNELEVQEKINNALTALL